MDTLTAIGTILGIAAVMVLRDLRDGKSVFKRNGTAESAKFIKELRDSQLELQEHFNDETTVILKEVRSELKELNKNLLQHTITEEGFQREMRDFLSESRRK